MERKWENGRNIKRDILEEIDIQEKKRAKFLRKILTVATILFLILLVYRNRVWFQKNIDRDITNLKIITISNFAKDKIEKTPQDESAIIYTEKSRELDTGLLLEEEYESLGVIYEGGSKTLEKREVEGREYLYDLKRNRQYTGEVREKVGEKREKVSKYLNGFLDEYSIYLQGELESIKRFYKSGNERIEIIYEKGEIRKIKESYDIPEKNSYKLITSYMNGKKEGEELIYHLDGSVEKKIYRKGVLID